MNRAPPKGNGASVRHKVSTRRPEEAGAGEAGEAGEAGSAGGTDDAGGAGEDMTRTLAARCAGRKRRWSRPNMRSARASRFGCF
ncbi:MAG: hypothetical protein ABIS67_07925 [Candidatus Eisenbacteria bacterium]